MELWHKGCKFISLLERKKKLLQGVLTKEKKQLSELMDEVANYRKEHDTIVYEISTLIPSGIMSRDDIYKGIRHQGRLLARQQLVFHEINKLEDDIQKIKKNIEQCQVEIVFLDKKNHKFSSHLNSMKREYIRCCDQQAENEIQELVSYGRKSIWS